MPSSRFAAALALNIILVTVLSSCAPGLVPIQLARVAQTESYTQTFSFLDNAQLQSEVQFDRPNARIHYQNWRIDEVFTQLLGPKNWQNLKDLYGLGPLREELLHKEIVIRGLINFSVYIDPVDHKRFLLEGFGRFFLVRQKTGEILLSGDFHAPAQSHTISELNRGFLLTDVRLFVTRVPERITYLSEAPLKYKIHVDNRLKEDRIYAIDYSKKHQVYLLDTADQAKPQKKDLIAEVTMHDAGHAAKLLDLRGMQFLKRDYEEKLRRTRGISFGP